MSGRTIARYATVAALVTALGGVFVYRQFLSPEADNGPRLGVVDAGSAVGIGQAAPDFVLEDARTGQPVALSDFRGRTVVLNFWATWCPPCRSEMPDLEQAYQQRLGDGDLVVLGVDFQEGTAAVQSFIDEFNLSFPIVIDRTGSVREHYGVLGLPGTFFIDRDGILRSQNLGPVFGDLLPDGIAAADRGGARQD